jgi:ubiquinone/menaquinone biosynthesis C-methylase UbiE
MDVLTELKQNLVCPRHRIRLNPSPELLAHGGVPFSDGDLKCLQGCQWRIERGIPRFVSPRTYASGFGYQWQRYPKTQLDSYTGHHYSRERLERCLGGAVDTLKGKAVLECGAGAGRFTEILAPECEALVSLDLSSAVEANLRNCSVHKPYMLLQADINQSPLPYGAFDVVVCLGVIQHTPFPEQTIASLARHVKPNGMLVIDHYTVKSIFSKMGQFLTVGYPIRAVLKRVSRLRPDLALEISAHLTAICDPIRRHTCRIHSLDGFISRLLPSACYYTTFPGVDPRIIYEWNELDTHDKLTDWFKHFRSPDQIRRCLEHLGFEDIYCTYGGNGVEARGLYRVQGNLGNRSI